MHFTGKLLHTGNFAYYMSISGFRNRQIPKPAQQQKDSLEYIAEAKFFLASLPHDAGENNFALVDKPDSGFCFHCIAMFGGDSIFLSTEEKAVLKEKMGVPFIKNGTRLW